MAKGSASFEGHDAPERASPAAGTLARTPLAHLLVYASSKSLSGSLILAEGNERVTIELGHGFVRDVKTSSPVAYLGQILYELGIIDTDTLNASLAELARKRTSSPPPPAPVLHGEVLLALGALTREALDRALRVQIERKIIFAFSMTGAASFEFVPGEPKAASAEVDPYLLVWRGMRECGSVEFARSVLARYGDTPLRLDPSADLGRYGLTTNERALAESFRTGAKVPDERTPTLLAYVLVITKSLVPHVGPSRFSTPPGMNRVEPPRVSERVPVAAASSPPPSSPTSRRSPPKVKVTGDAKINLQNAEVAFAQRDFELAETLCRSAYEEEPLFAESLAFLAWIQNARTTVTSAAALAEPLKLLERALDLHPGCERAYMYRAHIRQRIGDHEGAFADFRTAYTLNPNNVEAAREVRLREMRTRQSQQGSSGLFGRLGKK